MDVPGVKGITFYEPLLPVENPNNLQDRLGPSCFSVVRTAPSVYRIQPSSNGTVGGEFLSLGEEGEEGFCLMVNTKGGKIVVQARSSSLEEARVRYFRGSLLGIASDDIKRYLFRCDELVNHGPIFTCHGGDVILLPLISRKEENASGIILTGGEQLFKDKLTRELVFDAIANGIPKDKVGVLSPEGYRRISGLV